MITFYVALAVFAQESTWNFYDSRVPELLRDYIASAAVIGLLMGMDNLLGVFIQPAMGNRSDNTRTAWGRRIPYLAVMMPLGAVLFLLIPHASSLGWLILLIFLYAVVMNSFKPISESLLPDFIRPERRSRANAAVKTAAALTVIVAALVSLLLVDDHPQLAFAVPAGLMLAAAAVLVWKVRDSDSDGYQAALAEDAADAAVRGAPGEATATEGAATQGAAAEGAAATGAVTAGAEGQGTKIGAILRDLARDPDRSRLLMIVTVFVFGSAWAASRALMTPYGVEALGLSDGEAGGLTLPSGIAYILAAFPAALLAERFGRLRVIMVGMAIFAVGTILGTVVQNPVATMVTLCLAAAGAAGFMINAVVVLWNLAPSSRVVGTYTGLYTVGWAGGAMAGPALVGLAVDLTGWHLMLLHITVLALIAIVLVIRVDRLQRGAAAQGRSL
ncbi:MFS transporter [Nonomuraea soli]|uniref:MFS family permease n=1 Tax=Nonomuraea soli TaxID=1032476 RepID=A0A7W0CIE5_9ACTN|nr:MFS transporter [Nonomuraea soli]MBA2891756.1 MFS family permease [Nonomuraea soli]